MSQRRLNVAVLVHVHKDLADQLSLLEVANKFVNTEHHMTVFGTFSETGM